jgi:hypothetical protein
MTILPQLERDLSKAAEQRLRAPDLATPNQRASGARLTRIVGGLPVILAVAVAILITVIALASLHHGGNGHSPTAPSTSNVAPRVQLIRSFSVLRRPQTHGDLNPDLLSLYFQALGAPSERHLPPGNFVPVTGPPFAIRRWGYPALDRRLTRVVNIPKWQTKVLIAPMTFRPSAASRRRTEGINLVIDHPGTGLTGTGPEPVSVRSVVSRGLAIFTGSARTANYGALFIPDGVATVMLGPFVPVWHGRHRPDINLRVLDYALDVRAKAGVEQNIAAFQFAIPTVATAQRRSNAPGTRGGSLLFGVPTLAKETWLDRNGHVLRRTTIDADFLVRIRLKRASGSH